VQVPSLVATIAEEPLADEPAVVATLLPLLDWTVTELPPPVVKPETWPPPAVTEDDSESEGGPPLRSTTLQPFGLSAVLPSLKAGDWAATVVQRPSNAIAISLLRMAHFLIEKTALKKPRDPVLAGPRALQV
jgi:hypothetical protein